MTQDPDEHIPDQLVEEGWMHDRRRGVVDRDAVEVVQDAGARVDPLEDLQPHGSFVGPPYSPG